MTVASPESLESLILLQGQILYFRRMAASGRFALDVANPLYDLADEIEATARKVDAEDLE